MRDRRGGRRPPSWLPNEPQSLLIAACLADDDDLEIRLRAWEAAQELAVIDAGSHRLLPLLYSRLRTAGITAQEHARLKGAYVKAWVEHVSVRREALSLVDELSASGIRPLLLKGVALQATAYAQDPIGRPSSDVDVLVRPEEFPRARDWLVAQGFTWDPQYSPEDRFQSTKSVSFSRGDIEVDVHTRIFQWSADPVLEDRLRHRSEEIVVDGIRFETLSPTDHLLHAVVHGSGWNAIPSIRWIVDSALIVRGTNIIDWDVLCDEVNRCELHLPTRPMLEHLERVWRVPIPGSTLTAIARQRQSLAGRLMYRGSQAQTKRTMRFNRIAYGEYLCRRDPATIHRAWLLYPLKEPAIALGMVREFKRRHRSAPRATPGAAATLS